MRLSILLIIGLCTLTFIQINASFAQDALHATCFNYGNNNDVMAIWHYENYSTWQEARANIIEDQKKGIENPVFVLSFDRTNHNVSVPDMAYCFLMYRDFLIDCVEGEFIVHEHVQDKSLKGEYSFKLRTKKYKKLKFTADFCPKGK